MKKSVKITVKPAPVNTLGVKPSKEIIQEVNFLVINRQGYPIKNNTLKMLKTYKVNFEISTINIPNISSSMIRLNTNYSNLPKSILDGKILEP